jgi:hypothetical protein
VVAGEVKELARNITGVADSAHATTQALSQTGAAVAKMATMADGLRQPVSQFRYGPATGPTRALVPTAAPATSSTRTAASRLRTP